MVSLSQFAPCFAPKFHNAEVMMCISCMVNEEDILTFDVSTLEERGMLKEIFDDLRELFFLPKCVARVPGRSRFPFVGVPKKCCAIVPRVSQEYPRRVFRNSVKQELKSEYLTKVSDKSVKQECPTRVSSKQLDIPQTCHGNKMQNPLSIDKRVSNDCLHVRVWAASCLCFLKLFKDFPIMKVSAVAVAFLKFSSLPQASSHW